MKYLIEEYLDEQKIKDDQYNIMLQNIFIESLRPYCIPNTIDNVMIYKYLFKSFERGIKEYDCD